MAAGPTDSLADRVVTIPNVITLLRLLLLVPVCVLILVGAQGSWWPLVIIALWASTDWIDGFLARRLNQQSRLGEMLDPIADRLGIVGVTLTLAVAGVINWWLLAVIVLTDLVTLAFAGRAGREGTLHVSWLGKIRTALLFTGLVVLVLDRTVWPGVEVAGQVLFVAGTVLHVAAGLGYVLQARRSHPTGRA